eukprot:538806_1
MSQPKEHVYAIGANTLAEFGLNHTKNKHKLTHLRSKYRHTKIATIYSGDQYAIYADKDNNDMWVSGDNRMSQSAYISKPNLVAIIQPKLIKYFNKHNINIQKVCTNTNASSTFWISIGKVYATGWNVKCQLGSDYKDKKNKIIPQLIKSLKNPIDIQPGNEYSIALCAGLQTLDMVIVGMIIEHWWRTCVNNYVVLNTNIQIPNDVIKVIFMFHTNNDGNKVMTTTGKGTWKEIKQLKNKKIIKIRKGKNHCLFLGLDGTVWSSGCNDVVQLGDSKLSRNYYGKVYEPKRIQYFIERNIKIVDIECGSNHSLVLDRNGNVYSWGENRYGQCGNGNTGNVITPIKVDIGRYVANGIGCGTYHSYVRTSNGRHYLFGRNKDNECIVFNNKNIKRSPYCINRIVKKK